jgi:hypothetical protein
MPEQAEPELEPSAEQSSDQTGGPTAEQQRAPNHLAAAAGGASGALDPTAIAAAFALLTPALLKPFRDELEVLRTENRDVRAQLKLFAEARPGEAPGAAAEPEVFYTPDYATENPHFSKPASVSDKPQLFPLRGDKTADQFAENSGAHAHEYGTLSCACYFLVNVLKHLDGVLPRILWRVKASDTVTDTATTGNPATTSYSGRDDADHLHAVYSSVKEIYDGLLHKRLQFLQLRAMLSAGTKDGKIPADKKGLLEVFTNKLYGAMRQDLPENLDETFRKTISDWEKQTNSASIKEAGRATATQRARANPATSPATATSTARRKPKKVDRRGGGK